MIPQAISVVVIARAAEEIKGADMTRDEMRAGVTSGEAHCRYKLF